MTTILSIEALEVTLEHLNLLECPICDYVTEHYSHEPAICYNCGFSTDEALEDAFGIETE